MFKEGQEVLVTKGDAEGNIGIIVATDSSSVTYLVKFKNGKTLWKHRESLTEVTHAQAKTTFQEGQEVWVAFKGSRNKYKAVIIATGEHFTCVHSWVGTCMERKEIVENERVYALDYDKVKTIRIGNYDVPEPIRDLPDLGRAGNGKSVWIPSLSEDLCFTLGVGNSYTRVFFEKGLCHWTKEAAMLHAEALLSFTTTEPQDD